MAGSATAPSGDVPSGADLRAQILSEMGGSGSPAVEAAPAEPAAQPAEEQAAEPEVEAAPVDADEPADEEQDEPAEDEDTPADPETAKRLDVVRRAEKRMRAQVEAKEAELAQREQRLSERLTRAEEIDRLAARAKYDPGAVMRALGLSDDDFAVVAQALYAESKEGAADPKRKEMAARLLREREQHDKLSAIEKRAIELEQKLERQKQEAAAQAEAARYFEQMHSAATSKHPLVAHMLKADPDDTAQALVASYERLATGGKVPAAAAVVADFDKQIRAKFKRLGLDPDALTGAKPKTTTAAPTKKAAPVVETVKSGTPSKDEILAELAALSS